MDEFKPKPENWFYCQQCETIAYEHDCCGHASCSGGGCDVCCGQGPESPDAVIDRMIRDGTAPDKSTVRLGPPETPN